MLKILFGQTLSQLTKITEFLRLPVYTARQIAQWMYQKDITSIDEMTNLSLKARELLQKHYILGINPPHKVQKSTDGTKKYLFTSEGGKYFEAAYIPEKERATLCVSSQVGCKMGCLFCMTAKQGFQSQLSAGEIVNQIRSLPERRNLTNIVYMGMGEPFDNLDQVMQSLEILTSDWGFGMSPRRITVSTIGILPAMKHFIENSQCHLAISLHSPFENERKQLMPIESVYSIDQLINLIKTYDFGKQRRISFEYIMFDKLNDSPKHVKEIVRILQNIKCRINLIRFHPIPGTPLRSSGEETINEFMLALNKKGIRTTVRASRGQDILAACGLLSTKELIKKQSLKDSVF